jgi:hypothetical protein
MGVVIHLNRYIPQEFLEGTGKKDSNMSQNESFAKSVFSFVTGISEEIIVRGDANKGEPDFIFNENDGLEVTFSSNRDGPKNSSIGRLHTRYSIDSIQNDLIESITDSLKEKANKKYRGVNSITPFIISLDPFFGWYDTNLQFSSLWESKRDDFFTDLNKDYIQNGIFKNIYILQITEKKTYALFDLRAFLTPDSDFLTIIGTNKIDQLPYCEQSKSPEMKESSELVTFEITNIIKK